jgi:hypothetical protein
MVKKISIINIYYHDFTLLIIEAEDDDLDIERTRGTVTVAMLPSLGNTIFPLSAQIKNLECIRWHRSAARARCEHDGATVETEIRRWPMHFFTTLYTFK